MSEESLQRRLVWAFGRLRGGKAALFSGPAKFRAGCRLHFGWSGGTLSAGRELILKIPAKDSRVGDPFSATVVDEGTYQNARVYGRITHIDLSGKIEGHTTMMLEFNRLVMPDGRQAPIRAEIVELIMRPRARR